MQPAQQLSPDANTTIRKLISLNQEHSVNFINSQRSRQIYREQHPTEIGVMKCMDGRVHFPVITNTPLGIAQPWRTIGGKFDTGWPHYKETIEEWADYASSRGRNSVVFATYHFARGFAGEDAEAVKYRCCAGFKYDTDAAKQASFELKEQFHRVFLDDGLYVIQCGIETDLEALILHAENGEVWDLGEAQAMPEDEILQKLQQMYPNIPQEVLNDILPMVVGNIEHVAKVKEDPKPAIDLEHREQVIAVGRGFDWLHTPNFALIIGPYSDEWKSAVGTAASVIKGNLEANRIDPSEGLALLVSTPYRSEGYKRRMAIEKAKYLTREAKRVIGEMAPEILPHLQVLTGVCDMNTRKMYVIES